MRNDTEALRTKIEEELSDLPLVQYAWLDTAELEFSERVHIVCREECPRYGASWSCPPGTGTAEQCRERCLGFDGAFLFTTIAEVQDAANLEETLATRQEHDAILRTLKKRFQNYTPHVLGLSGSSCDLCAQCTYPDAPCRCPERMLPCIEGYAMVVPVIAEKAGIEFSNGANIITWFGIVLYGGLLIF